MRPRSHTRPRSGRLITLKVLQGASWPAAVGDRPSWQQFERQLHPEVWSDMSLRGLLQAALVAQAHQQRGWQSRPAQEFVGLDCEHGVWLDDLSVTVAALPELRTLVFVERRLAAQLGPALWATVAQREEARA